MPALAALTATACTPGMAARPAGSAVTGGTPAPSTTRPDAAARACGAFHDTLLQLPDAGAPGDHRTVWVHRPAGPDSADLPVLYLLHGYPGSAADVARSTLGSQLDRLMCRSGRPIVIVAPDGNDAGNDDTEWSDDAHGRFDIESFLTGQLITAVEGAHRRPARLRAIGGWSMGGYGAAALALRNPSLYRQVVTFGGYFRVDDPDDAFGTDDSAHSPDQLLDNARGMRFFLAEGTQDYESLQIGTIHGEADRFAALLGQIPAQVTVVHPQGGHNMGTWQQAFPAMITFLDAGWAASPAPPASPTGAPSHSGSAAAAPGARPAA